MDTVPAETPSDSEGLIALPEKLDTGAAAALHAQLLAKVGKDVVLDGSSVEVIGGRCTDILMSARAKWQADGANLDLIAPSDAMRRNLSLLGTTPEALTTGGAP
ncbi:MAG: STAS domain-containing protein [Pseudomonadota bacterium]